MLGERSARKILPRRRCRSYFLETQIAPGRDGNGQSVGLNWRRVNWWRCATESELEVEHIAGVDIHYCGKKYALNE